MQPVFFEVAIMPEPAGRQKIHRRPARRSVGYRLLGFGALVPVVELSSGIHVIALRSYLKPLALLSASLVVLITKCHLLLSLVLAWTALNGTATSFSPAPRKPPTPMINAVALPSLSSSTSMISPILLSLGS